MVVSYPLRMAYNYAVYVSRVPVPVSQEIWTLGNLVAASKFPRKSGRSASKFPRKFGRS